MLTKSQKGTTFFCFSPPVMIATCIIEVVLLIYTLYRYKLNRVTQLAVAMLFSLALFQLAEYNVCGGMGLRAAEWSRVGFVAITMLPVLGVHLIQTVSGKGSKIITWAAYATAAMWAIIFGFTERAFSGHVCEGNYVIFQLKEGLTNPYSAYYYGWLLVGIIMALQFAASATKKVREALILVVVGYLVFLVPTITANTINPDTIGGIPSIMCGFAVLFALILTFAIMPRIAKRKKQKS